MQGYTPNTRSDLDQYNIVRENSNLTHENMLFSANNFGDNKVEIGLYSNDYGQERIAQQSIGSYVKQFKHNSSQDPLSILLCSGNVKTNQRPTGNSYSELTGDSHWTTLHLRKDQVGNIQAFYSDSLSHDNNDINTIPTSVLKALNASGIESKNIKKIQCERQPDYHKCGDHALFNALAMNQTNYNQFLASDRVKEEILIGDVSNQKKINVAGFYNPHRSTLAKEFNLRITDNNTPPQSQQTQTRQSQQTQPPQSQQTKQLFANSSRSQTNQNIIVTRLDELDENLKKYNALKNTYDSNNYESMIDRAISLSLIEQQNLELLEKFKNQIQPFADKITGKDFAKNFVNDISSPLIAANLEKFLPLLKKMKMNPSIIKDTSFQKDFRNIMAETRGSAGEKKLEEAEAPGDKRRIDESSWQKRTSRSLSAKVRESGNYKRGR